MYNYKSEIEKYRKGRREAGNVWKLYGKRQDPKEEGRTPIIN